MESIKVYQLKVPTKLKDCGVQGQEKNHHFGPSHPADGLRKLPVATPHILVFVPWVLLLGRNRIF